MELTLKEALEKSIELWEWLEETGSMYKYRWPKWKEYSFILNLCFLCEYVRQYPRIGEDDEELDCAQYCPISQGESYGCQNIKSHPYSRWYDAVKPETRKKYAGLLLEELKQALAEVKDG